MERSLPVILRNRLAKLRTLCGEIVARPNQVRHLPRWVRDWDRQTIGIRQPMWPYSMTALIAARLRPGDRVFEYGSGGSTLWFQDHQAIVTAVEHDPEWNEVVGKLLSPPSQVLLMEPTERGMYFSRRVPGFFDDYVNVIADYSDESFDLVSVDGRCRVDCVEVARSKVRPGGLLLVDDMGRSDYAPISVLLSGWHYQQRRGLVPCDRDIVAIATLFTRPLANGHSACPG